MRVAMLALVVLVLAPIRAGAVTIVGAGLESCGAWSTNHRLEMNVWVYGFMSRAALDPRGSDPLRTVDAEALDGWMTNYCKEHPLDSIATAAQVLEQELWRRKAAAPGKR